MLLRETNEGCTVLAPAKLNLCLEILGRLPHGYHEIRTLMCPIRWFDTLSVRSKEVADQEDPIELHVHGAKDVPVGKDNLVAAALSELKCHAGCKKGVRVDLVKRIPSQAGLGGGSSDAAAALIAANRLWRLGLSCDDLKAIGAGLGSDIPFFIHAIMARGGCSAGGARAAICTGRGEQVESTPSVGGAPCVIVKPKFGLSTAKVYREYSNGEAVLAKCNARRAAFWLSAGRWRSRRTTNEVEAMGNALQAAALRIAPAIDRIRRLMNELPVSFHQLSGSGSAYFALCGSAREARRVASILRANRLGSVFTTSTI